MHDAEENEVLYGRKVITPKLYLHHKDPKEITKGFEEWYKIARCICDCGSEVKLKSHWEHKKSKKHLKNMKEIQEKEGCI